VRTALLAWLDARSLSARFVLRIEDLDQQRCTPAARASLLQDLRWLGLDWDEGPDLGGAHGPYIQSQRQERYAAAVARLVHDQNAFSCSCSRAEIARAVSAPHAGEDGPRYPGSCHAGPGRPDRPTSTRLRVRDGRILFDDLVMGPQAFDVGATVGDFVIARADGVAAYQLAVSVDDSTMEITRVVRGDDLLSSTPRQLLVLDALGLRTPRYGHVPLLVDSSGQRLSKRGGALAVATLRDHGIRAESIVGWLARSAGLGDGQPCHPGDLLPRFDWARVPRTPSIVEESSLATLARG